MRDKPNPNRMASLSICLKKKLKITVGIVIGLLCLIAAIPYCLTPHDTSVKLGTISANGFYSFTNNADGALVNIIAEPVEAVERFKISGSMMLNSRNFHHEQDFATSNFARDIIKKTNCFYLRPSVPLPPRNQDLVVRINLEKEATSPFNLILRYRTYVLPPFK